MAQGGKKEKKKLRFTLPSLMRSLDSFVDEPSQVAQDENSREDGRGDADPDGDSVPVAVRIEAGVFGVVVCGGG